MLRGFSELVPEALNYRRGSMACSSLLPAPSVFHHRRGAFIDSNLGYRNTRGKL